MIAPIALLQKLIAFKSITPQDDLALDFIAELLSTHGFTVYLKTFGPDKIKNLYAATSYPNTTSFNLCFAGHIDVVQPGLGWASDPFEAVCRDGKIYGRGAVDMKGALACMIAAVLNFLKEHKSTVSFLITADEEGDAEYGTKAMLEWMWSAGHKIDFAIVGEPTSEKVLGDKIKIGRRGSISFTLEVKGLQGHVAYPHLSVNPNTLIVRILNDLINFKFDGGNDVFMPSNLEITSIDVGNIIGNIIPGCASAKFNIRYNNEHTQELLLELIESVISKRTKNYSLSFRSNAQPFLSQESDITKIFSSSVKTITNITPVYATDGGTSDARFLQNYCPVLEFGLLSGFAHKIDEHVEIGDLQKLYDVYYHALRSINDCTKVV
jgi:succinyl-diaminopimelate desuccinylase